MRSRLLEWMCRLAGPHALSWPALLLIWGPSTLWSVAYLTAHGDIPFGWALVWGCAAWSVMGLIWLIAERTWMRWATPGMRMALILPTYALAAFCRSLIVVYVGGPFEGPSPVPLGVLTMTLVSVAATLVAPGARAVVEIACEAVNNAVLRGGAHELVLDVSVQGRTIHVRVVHASSSGGADTRPRTPGLGTALFDDLADSWSLETAHGTTEFSARVGLAFAGPRRPAATFVHAQRTVV